MSYSTINIRYEIRQDLVSNLIAEDDSYIIVDINEWYVIIDRVESGMWAWSCCEFAFLM